MVRLRPERILGLCISMFVVASAAFAAPPQTGKLHFDLRWDKNVPAVFELRDNAGNSAWLSPAGGTNNIANCQVTVTAYGGTISVNPTNGGTYAVMSYVNGTSCVLSTWVQADVYFNGCLEMSNLWPKVNPCYQPEVVRHDWTNSCLANQSRMIFSPVAASTDADRRMILKKQRTETDPGIDYTSAYQRALVPIGIDPDGRIKLELRVTRDSGEPRAFTYVYFRILDPPDPAEYAVLNSRSHADDNRHVSTSNPLEKAFKLEPLTPLDPAALTAQTNQDGVVTLILKANTTWAGDNAIVQASLVPFTDNTCPVASCGSTGVISAWKRLYVEQDAMFKASAFLAADSVPADKWALVDFDADRDGVIDAVNAKFVHGALIRFVHAPRRDGSGTPGFWFEDRTVDTVLPQATADYPGAYRISFDSTEDPLRNPYGLDRSFGGVVPYFRDAVGILRDGFYSTDTAIMGAHLAAGFREVVVLTASPGNEVTTIPVQTVPSEYRLQEISQKWCESCDHSTVVGGGPSPATMTDLHQHLIGGATGFPPQPGKLADAGNTITANYDRSYVWRTTIETYVSQSASQNPLGGLALTNVLQEATAHEIAHRFGRECTERAYKQLNGDRYCIMSSPNNLRELGNGTFLFHYLRARTRANDNSEYLNMRSGN